MSSSGPRGCALCGKELQAPERPGRTRLFCGATCRSAARRQRADRVAPSLAEGPFPTSLRAGIGSSGLPLRAVSDRLGDAGHYLSPSTLSHWQQGHSTPRPTAATRDQILALERALSLPPTQLISALERSRRSSADTGAGAVSRGHRRRPPAAAPLESRRSRLEGRLADEFGVDRADVVLITQQEHYRIGPNRRPVSSSFELTACAVGESVGSYWCICCYEPAAPTTIVPVHGCTRDRQLDEAAPDGDPNAPRLRAVELRFDLRRSLGRGETHEFGFVLEYANAASNDLAVPLPEREFHRHLPTAACRELEMSIQFDCPHQPINLTRTWSHPRSGQPSRGTPATLTAGQDRIRHTNPAPGTYGWRWGWPGDHQVAPPATES